MSRLTIRNLSVRLSGMPVVNRVSFDVGPGDGEKGELVALVGPNGAGKTTIMRAALGLIDFDGGIAIDGEPVAGLDDRARARAMAYLPQAPVAHWPLSVEHVVSLGRTPHMGPGRKLSAGDKAAVARALDAADAGALKDRNIWHLSGGERARVFLARAFAAEAPLLLCDEPTNALDPGHKLDVMAYLRKYADDGGAVLIVLHDLALAARFADRLVLINQGKLVAEGAPEDVLTEANLESVYGVRSATADELAAAPVIPWERV